MLFHDSILSNNGASTKPGAIHFYYIANKQAQRQHNLVLVDHTAVLGQAVNISVKQKGESLVFSINGKEETFPVPLKAGILEYHCSSGACEFRD